MHRRWSFLLEAVLAVVLAGAVSGAAAPELPSSLGKAAGKRPEPDDAAQKEAEKKIKELFKREYGSRNALERRALAARLLETAQATNDDVVACFVLLREARDLAADAGDAPSAVLAIDRLAERFAVDARAMKAEALAVAARKAVTQADQEAAVRECLREIDEAAVHYDLENARALVSAAKTAGRKVQNAWLAFHIEAREKRVEQLSHWEKEVAQAFDKWNQVPEDPGANLVLGEYLCLGQGDWKTGLPYLKKGANPFLGTLAEAELEEPRTPEQQVALAARWWDASETAASSRFKEQTRERAFHWYARALPGLSGISSVEVEKRLNQRPRCYLSDLQELDVKVGAGEFGKQGKLGFGSPPGEITVSGVKSPSGIYMHGTSQGYSGASYRLGGRYKKLEACAALNDTVNRPRSAFTFIVEGDGKALWKSKPIAERGKPQRCAVSIAGVDMLRLVVYCPGSHVEAHAVWLDPEVVR